MNVRNSERYREGGGEGGGDGVRGSRFHLLTYQLLDHFTLQDWNGNF